MPELAAAKIHPYPKKHPVVGGGEDDCAKGPAYAELFARSNFTFLRGASHPEELVEQAKLLRYRAIAVVDRNSVAGIVRGHLAAQQVQVPYVVGVELCLADPEGLQILVYPTDLVSYGRLCRLLTVGKRRAAKGRCVLSLHDLVDYQSGLLAVIVPPPVLDQAFLEIVQGLHTVFDDDRLSLAASCLRDGRDHDQLAALADLGSMTRVPLVATNRVEYHVAGRRVLHDVVTCIREGCTLATAGYRLQGNAEQHLKTPEEMSRLFRMFPEAVARTIEIAARAGGFSLDEIQYQYPHEVCPPGRTPDEHLAELAWHGSRARYPTGVPEKVRRQIAYELNLIAELDYAPYFLTVHDLVEFARSRDILCQGRGAAANSAVCYCLGVTAVDPNRIDVLFERFISKERDEPPDIDIDFEHERREEVIQYIYNKYGRDRAALVAEVISYRGRSAIREVGKVLGMSLDFVDRLARNMEWWHDRVIHPDRIRELGIDPDEPTMRRFTYLVGEILGFPRHLSQHVGGFVITQGPLCELVPVENAAMEDRTVIEWDKDDIDAMGMMKVDVLGLGMLTCIRKVMEFVNERRDGVQRMEPMHATQLELHNVPPEDPDVYDMICAADTVGVFQIESRAQMSMLPRLRPRCFYDLVIEIAIVRPGPIQGKMVHPYLRRRDGKEPVSYPSDAVRDVLGKTLGVPLFQEQAMALAIVAAGFTPGEADQLRRAMAAWKRKGNQIAQFGSKLITGMVRKGYDQEFAERCFDQIKGFSEYGFPESHAASFALLVYISCWLKYHEPASFAAGLINSQPMGFYAPAQIIRDVRDHGVTVREIDINHSMWDCTLEDTQWLSDEQPVLRLGMRLIKSLRRDEVERIEDARVDEGAFDSIEAVRRRSGVSIQSLRKLARADAFRSLGFDRQAALWQIRSMRDESLPMFEEALAQRPVSTLVTAGDQQLPHVSELRKVMQDYESVQLSLRAHPMSFVRDRLDDQGIVPARDLLDLDRFPMGTPVAVAGIVLVRQRPSTASGIVFMTLEDESGIANLILRPAVYERCRRAARHGVVVIGRGKVERQGEVVHVLVNDVSELDDADVAELRKRSRDFH